MISIVTGIIMMVLDAYVLAHFHRSNLRHGRSPWLSRVSWIITIVMTVLYWYVVWQRHYFRLEGVDAIIFAVVCIWMLPKIGIVPVLLGYDMYRFARMSILAVLNKFRPKRAEQRMDPQRRKMLSSLGWSSAIVPFGIVANGIGNTASDYEIHHVEIPLPNLPRAFDGMRLVQLSDIHAGSYVDHRAFQEARFQLERLNPDAIMITGDFVNTVPSELSVIARELHKLRAPEGVFASLGNHDHYHGPKQHERLIAFLRSTGMNLLINDRKIFGAGADRLVIAGTDNTGLRQNFADLRRALRGTNADDAIILLAHDPTFFEKGVRTSRVDLMLSGHTHGGQVGFTGFGIEWSPAQYVYKHWAGLYREGDKHIYVNRGLGTVGPPIRIGIRPEITHITLRREEGRVGLG